MEQNYLKDRLKGLTAYYGELVMAEADENVVENLDDEDEGQKGKRKRASSEDMTTRQMGVGEVGEPAIKLMKKWKKAKKNRMNEMNDQS